MADFKDLAEHTGTLVAIGGILLTICGALIVAIWKIVSKTVLSLKDDVLKLIDKVDSRVTMAFGVMEEHRREQASINEVIRARQEKLREELPEKFLRVEGPGFKMLIEGIERVEKNFEEFAKNCHEGRCELKKARRV